MTVGAAELNTGLNHISWFRGYEDKIFTKKYIYVIIDLHMKIVFME